MKKTLTLIAIAGMFSFYACGPSAEQKAAAEKVKQDSIAAATAAAADAAAAVEKAKQDSIAAVQAVVAEKAKQDSIAAAEATSKKGAKPKTMEKKVKEEAKKASSGRG